MKNLAKIYTLKDEAQNQLYQWFDKEVRPLSKKLMDLSILMDKVWLTMTSML